MNSNIKTALDKWIKSIDPFSFHPVVMDNFYELVHECIKENYILTQENIADAMIEHLELDDSKVEEESIKFEKKAEDLLSFVKFLNENKYTDIKSTL